VSVTSKFTYWSSTSSPTRYGSGRVITRSGSPIDQPVSDDVNRFGGGAALGSPAGAPPRAQATNVSMSSGASTRSLLNCPRCSAAACHGGM
jgi:hypothetical protein